MSVLHSHGAFASNDSHPVACNTHARAHIQSLHDTSCRRTRGQQSGAQAQTRHDALATCTHIHKHTRSHQASMQDTRQRTRAHGKARTRTHKRRNHILVGLTHTPQAYASPTPALTRTHPLRREHANTLIHTQGMPAQRHTHTHHTKARTLTYTYTFTYHRHQHNVPRTAPTTSGHTDTTHTCKRVQNAGVLGPARDNRVRHAHQDTCPARTPRHVPRTHTKTRAPHAHQPHRYIQTRQPHINAGDHGLRHTKLSRTYLKFTVSFLHNPWRPSSVSDSHLVVPNTRARNTHLIT